ncbi:unnamed protein product, partial [Ectocarpus sp. 6 AP-2014]
VQAQVAACLLRRGTIRFDNRTGVNVVSSLVKGWDRKRWTPTWSSSRAWFRASQGGQAPKTPSRTALQPPKNPPTGLVP